MTTKLHRTFESRERFVADFVRDLSEREMEVDLPDGESVATGEMVDFDFRLDDGSPLLVGTGMVVRGGAGEADASCRIRFLGLTEGSRAALDELVVETGTPPGGEARAAADPDETLEDLVAGAFGHRRRAAEEVPGAPAAEEEVFVPPASAPPPPESPEPRTPEADPNPAPSAEEPAPGAPPRKRSIWERLQVSPAVIVASLLAGVTGAAADYWFEELATFVAELRSADTAIENAPVIDIPPTGVAPSDFSVASLSPASGEPAPAPAPLPAEAPGPAPAASAETVPASQPEAAPADRIRLITWDEEPAGTVVTFWGNGPFLRDRVVRHRVQGGAPRELVKLRGIDLPYRLTAIDVGTEELARIRTGFHPQDRVNELHVVLDLPDPAVELVSAEADENRLRLHLEAVDPE